MTFGRRDTTWDKRQVVVGQFQSFTPARSLKSKNSKIKKHLKILRFYTSVSKIMIL